MEAKRVLIINGPNLNMTGLREPEIYGSETLSDINASVRTYANAMKIECDFFQSNCEGEIITKIHEVLDTYDGCIINAGAYTHYSYAILDALKAVGIPTAEVHISDIHAREEFRHNSVIKAACCVQICGKGIAGYVEAINYLRENYNK